MIIKTAVQQPPSGVWLQSRPLIANFLLAVAAEERRLLEPFSIHDQLLPPVIQVRINEIVPIEFLGLTAGQLN